MRATAAVACAVAFAFGCEAVGETDVLVLARDSAGVLVTSSTTTDLTFATVDTLPILSIGGPDATGAAQFSNIRGIYVDHTGNIWVADGASGEVRIFGEDGSHVRTVGGMGEGPGEFRRIRLLGAFEDGTIALWDDVNPRLTLLNPAGDLLRTVPVPSGEALGPQPLAAFGDGTLLAIERRTLQAESIEPDITIADTARLFRLDPSDASQTPITDVPGPVWLWTGSALVPVPFTINPGRTVYEGAVYVVQGPAFRVRVYRDRELVESYGVERDARAVTDAAVDEYVAMFEEAMPDSAQRAEYLSALDHPSRPAYMPGYDAVIVADDGSTWARFYNPDLYAPASWDVFGADRAWLGRVLTPARFTAYAIARSRIYGVWRDDLGVEYVRVYGLAGSFAG